MAETSRSSGKSAKSTIDTTARCQLDFPNESIGAPRNLAGAFQFFGDDGGKKIRALSGGESGIETDPHLYPGSYVEYVARTGREAPGVHV